MSDLSPRPRSEPPGTHWADEAAGRLLARGRRHVINTGITPSGPIHIGNMREILTGDAVAWALRGKGAEVVLNYIADTHDPLRRVYPFLDPAKYEREVGKPLSQIPCVCGGHASYAEHYLEPFLASIRELGISCRVLRADQMYAGGEYVDMTLRALEGRDRIAAILREETGKDVEPHWSPWNPQCERCGRLGTTRVLGWDASAKTFRYSCECGHEGERPFAGGGKLTWRVDWPARWVILGTTFEPFGKDHATSGGSYDTGKRIVREVFAAEPPEYVVYEWISLKGQGDMSSSKGNVVTISDMLRILPPDVLRFLIMGRPPQKTIEFDPGPGLAHLLAQFDQLGEAVDRLSRGEPLEGGKPPRESDLRAYFLSQISGYPHCPVPFSHLVTCVQIAGGDEEAALEVLARSGYFGPRAPREAVVPRLQYAHRWVEGYAPPETRFSLQETLPEAALHLDPLEKEALALLADLLQPGMGAEEAHNAFYEARDRTGIEGPRLFQAFYRAFLGRDRGPRAGHFVAALDHAFVVGRLREASRA